MLPCVTYCRAGKTSARHVAVTSQASSVGRSPVCCAGGRGFEPQTRPTLRGLKITEENALPL